MILRRIFMLISAALIIQSTGSSQIINNDFESWGDSLVYEQNFYSTFIDSATQAIPLDWNDTSGNNNGDIGYFRTTDAASGKYATVIYTWYSYVQTELGQEGSISNRATALNGKYKYLMRDTIIGGTDSATVSIAIFNFQGDTIGSGMSFLDTIYNYTDFSVPIVYQNEEMAHSYMINFKSSLGTCSSIIGQCKFLFIDDLKFEVSTSSEYAEQKDKMSVFPNPTRSEVRFSTPFKTCEVYDFQGRLISNYRNRDLIMLPQLSGLYLLKIEDLSGVLTSHKIIKL